MLHCPTCQTTNPEDNRFCQHCGAVLPKRYLWAVGKMAETLQPGQLLDDRYWVNPSCVLLETQPGLMPMLPGMISQTAYPYLRLSPYRLHVPQPYGCVFSHPPVPGGEVLLLEQAAIVTTGEQAGSLLPELTSQWTQASGLRQLHWLRQIAQLWQPFQNEQVALSLLTPVLIRVEGGLVRLLELVPDSTTTPPTLAQLGTCWAEWAIAAQPDIRQFLSQLCQWMIQGDLQTADQIIVAIDWGLQWLGKFQARQIQVCTLSDCGPTRQRNEDACYPPSGSVITHKTTSDLLAIVCDGIGGHEGGDIASNLAIISLQSQLQTLGLEATHVQHFQLVAQLEAATFHANDAINQRNDQQRKFDRQRMGTTLVIAVVHAHDLYITHVGDSRAYQITRTGCHQITLDDDYASREVRLGNSFYGEALQHHAAGSLVQGLGISHSDILHPTTQRFALDEDCVILLCSDGLSDNDRVEEYWQTEILPILEGNIDPSLAAQRLVQIANTQNGHDNVTVALLHCHVTQHPSPAPIPPPALEQLTLLAATKPSIAYHPAPSRLKTQLAASPKRQRQQQSPRKTLILVGMGIMLALLATPVLRSWLTLPSDLSTNPNLASPSPESGAPSVPVAPSPDLESSAIVKTTAPIPLSSAPASSPAQSGQPQNSAPVTIAIVPSGSILKVLKKQSSDSQTIWIQLKLCSAPDTTEPSPTDGQGWILQSDLLGVVSLISNPSPSDVGQCTTKETADPPEARASVKN